MLSTRKLAFLMVSIDFFMLIFLTSQMSIGGAEAVMFYEGVSLPAFLSRLSVAVFGANDFALRFPFLLFHVASAVLLYRISEIYLKKKSDALLSLLVFLLLPGVNSSALLINEAVIVVFLLLLFIYLYGRRKELAYALLPIMLLVDNAFGVFYLALFFYGVYKSRGFELISGMLFFGVSMYVYGLDTGGIPKGYFLDTLGGFSAILSPFLFLFFIYSIYRILIKEEKSLLWFVIFVPFVTAMLLSLRQKIDFETYGPYVVIAVPLIVKVFMNGYRVRLAEFRQNYRFMFGIVMAFLVFSFVILFFSKALYGLYEDKSKHFAYHYQVAKELADKLKKSGVNNVTSNNGELLLRLKFYGVESGDRYNIAQNEKCLNGKKVSILYSDVTVATYCVTKINNSQ